jgi:hypothetical protein
MKTRAIATAAVIVGVMIAGTAGISYAGSHRSHTVIEADSMVGVSPPYTGSTNPIRGINGGGAPWVIDRAHVELKSSGRLEVEVRGLVIGPKGPVAVVGTNPVPAFKATVSCLTIDANGAAATMNVSTDPFPADAAGNAEVEAMVSLPSPCIAPIVFVANGNAAGAWFASTGA